jgi:hypothetical protein
VTRRADDSGVTLIELVLATALTGLLAGVVGAAFVIGVKTTGAATDRIEAARHSQIVSAVFPVDAQSAKTITASPTGCAGAPATVAELGWTELDDAGTTSVVKLAQWTCTTSGGSTNLVRQLRVGGVLQPSLVVAEGITSAAVTCDPNCTTPDSARITVVTPGATTAVVAHRRAE